eukprot:scaffold283629_cov14-Tisochrysis_lutea.AAC.1
MMLKVSASSPFHAEGFAFIKDSVRLSSLRPGHSGKVMHTKWGVDIRRNGSQLGIISSGSKGLSAELKQQEPQTGQQQHAAQLSELNASDDLTGEEKITDCEGSTPPAGFCELTGVEDESFRVWLDSLTAPALRAWS